MGEHMFFGPSVNTLIGNTIGMTLKGTLIALNDLSEHSEAIEILRTSGHAPQKKHTFDEFWNNYYAAALSFIILRATNERYGLSDSKFDKVADGYLSKLTECYSPQVVELRQELMDLQLSSDLDWRDVSIQSSIFSVWFVEAMLERVSAPDDFEIVSELEASFLYFYEQAK